jgi:hypothetical protein
MADNILAWCTWMIMANRQGANPLSMHIHIGWSCLVAAGTDVELATTRYA